MKKMPNLDSGVARYITGKCTIEVYFPVDYKGSEGIACKYCPYLSSSMRMCQLNQHPVAFPERYIGSDCPLKIIKNESET